jgi:hypothetical protein
MAVDKKTAILAELKPMLEKARAEGLWFYCEYQDLWLSPEELVAANEECRFVWGRVNWTLRDPSERLKQLNAAIISATDARNRFAARMHSTHE